MTTGRINQVTTFHPHTPGDVMPDIHNHSSCFLGQGVHQRIMVTNLTATARECSQHGQWAQLGNSIKVEKSNSSCPPESHRFQTHLSLSSDKDQGLQRELPTTGIHPVMADSQVAR